MQILIPRSNPAFPHGAHPMRKQPVLKAALPVQNHLDSFQRRMISPPPKKLFNAPVKTLPAFFGRTKAHQAGEPGTEGLIEREQVIQSLQQKYKNVTITSQNALHFATCDLDSQALKILLETGSDPNEESPEPPLPMLMGRFVDGDEQTISTVKTVMKTLLAHGADINLGDYNGETPLMRAAERKAFLPLLDFLLENGADVNQPSYKSGTALAHAVSKSNYEAMEKLIAHHADVNSPGSTCGVSACDSYPLGVAAERGDYNAVQILLNAQADPNATDHERYNSMLMDAVNGGNPAVVKALLEAGADVHFRNTHDKTALMFAAEHSAKTGNADILKLLVEAGAEVQYTYKLIDLGHEVTFENNAMVEALKGKNCIDAVNFFISRGVDVNGGETPPLVISASHHDLQSVLALLKAGAQIDKPDQLGMTALANAAMTGDLGIVEALVDAGADLEQGRKAIPAIIKMERNSRWFSAVGGGRNHFDYENYNRIFRKLGSSFSSTGPSYKNGGERAFSTDQQVEKFALKSLKLSFNTSNMSQDDKKKLKSTFRKWAMDNHPDKGGDTTIFQKVSAGVTSLMNR